MKPSLPFLLILLSVCLPSLDVLPATAQTAESLGLPPAGIPEAPADRLPEPGAGLEGVIAGSGYRLGPGDVLTVSIWGPEPATLRLAVTLEGMLLIPDVGELSVTGLTLTEAKASVRRAVLGTVRNVEVGVTLTRLRRFQVHVLGEVQRPGTYLATAVDRVSSAVAWAGGLTPEAGSRRIQVSNGDSLRTSADLFLFLRRGMRDRNPSLRDGDIVLVPFIGDQVQLLGAVNDTGRVEFLPGDRFSDALRLAGGFRADAFLDTLEIVRYRADGGGAERFLAVEGSGLIAAERSGAGRVPPEFGRFTPPAVWLPGEIRPEYADFELLPEDRIFVRSTERIALRPLVELTGEVRFPGFYTIVPGKTTLSTVVAWAGGLTPEASLVGAQLIRRGVSDLEDRELERLKLIPVVDMRQDEYNYFKMKSRQDPGRMVVDFREAILAGNPEADVVLQDEDLISIPPRKQFVTVLGMVSAPGNVTFQPGLTARDYITLAGGYAEDAKEGGMRVIRATTGERIKPGDAGPLDPGDAILVPENPERDYWGLFRDLLLVTTQVLAIYVVIDRTTN